MTLARRTGSHTTHSHSRWIVAAGGRRDSYQVPIALHEAKRLTAFVTDFYTPLDFAAVRRLTSFLPRAVAGKLKRRYSPNLPSRLVKSCPLASLKGAGGYDWMEYNRVLGKCAGELAARRGAGIVSYAHLATSAFAEVDTLPKVLIQMQPHPVAVRNALNSDQFLPDLQEPGLMNELHWPLPVFDTLCRESLLADRCIVNSNYSRQTLIENGVNSERISIVPYGVDLDFFTPVNSESGTFKVLFVGQPIRQKGLHYLLEAWRRLKFHDAELRIVSREDRNNSMLSEYSSEFTFSGSLEWKELREEYRRADLLCLPSLSEGFGLVTLESLACGTPVLATVAAGSSELLSDGEDGFVVAAADLTRLMAALESAYSDRRQLRDMRVAARRKAEKFPWSRFREGIRGAVGNFEPTLIPSAANHE